ncbi:hypothetical protein AHF37_04046 [Paragonimus kellicotti]|nr:hypothetical protein AHF37_04046 [Paragonimus kellicotti]
MYEDKIASVVSLAKFAFSNLPDDSSFHRRLHNCFLLFTDLLPFDSPLDLEDFFRVHHFDNRRPMHTLYGTITTCDVSRKLQKLVLQRSQTLQKLCFVHLIRTSPPHMELEMLLKLPPHLFRQYIITAFAILWFPMSHAQFHSEDIDRSIPDDLQVVFRFLTNPYVFEKMYDVCSIMAALSLEAISYAQYVLEYTSGDFTYALDCADMAGVMLRRLNHETSMQAASANRVKVIPSATHLLDHYSSQIPLVPPHHFSNQLLINLRELFSRATRVKHNTPAEVTSVALLGLKMSNFLCESSEYVHALKVAQVIHEAVRTFFGLSQFHRAQLRLEYEILCVMLRSMNSFNMYVDPEDQQVFLKEAPNLLKALSQFDLFLHPSDMKVACIAPVLPPSLSSVVTLSSASPVRQTASVDWTDESLAEDLMGSVTSIVSGPSGDSSDPNSQGDSFIPSSPLLPEPYFPTTTADSDLVLALLSDAPGPKICTAYMHAQLANYYYVMCKYEVAYQFTLLAIGQLQASTTVGLVPSPQVTIEVLRIMCKICMIKRKYDLGLKIIRHALLVCRTYFGMHNLIYASLLLEYGCVLLNTDKTRRAARVYRPYFPTTTADSDLVLALLSDAPGPKICTAYMHAQLANYYYVMCKYEVAYQFTLLAIGQLQASTTVGLVPSPQVTIEVLRIMCKICMIKRKYDLGLKIIRHALLVCRTYFGMHNLIYASLLLEYGCVLLNTDKTRRAARVYRVGLALIINCLPGASIMAALSLEAISYAQ